jgi:CheY-like chemotaxis protein
VIILIEDNLSHALSIEYLFQRRNTAVIHVRSPLEGYPIALDHCTRKPLMVQAILIDLNLPIKQLTTGPDGLDVATLLLDDRAAGVIPQVPIMIISGEITEETEAYAQSIGIDAVATKPLDAAFIDRVLTASRASASASAARPTGRAVDTARKTVGLAQQLQHTIAEADKAPPAIAITEEEVWSVLATLFASFRFYKDSAEKRQLGITALDKLGGRRGFNDRYVAFIRYLKQKNLPYRTRQAQILSLLYQGVEKKQIEQRLGVGRRKLENAIEEIIRDLTEFLGRDY